MAFADDYVTVAERIAGFRAKHPEGSLQPFNPDEPVKVITIEGKTFLQYTACAYRSPDDKTPGIAIAWEVFPGTTNFTRNSEAMNLESSAWGRAIVAALAADTKKSVASADEVRVRQAERDAPPDPMDEARNRVRAAAVALGWDGNDIAADFAREHGKPVTKADLDELTAYAIRLEVSTSDVAGAA